jgi:GTP-binding protein EngB required for normal cell division
MSNIIKIAIVGSTKVGKGKYIGRWCTGEFKSFEEIDVVTNTTRGEIKMKISKKQDFVDSSDAVIIMFDRSKGSREYAEKMKKVMKQQKKPFICVQNKVDEQQPEKDGTTAISVKTHYNFDRPYNDLYLKFRQNKAIIPPSSL